MDIYLITLSSEQKKSKIWPITELRRQDIEKLELLGNKMTMYISARILLRQSSERCIMGS